MQSQTLHRSELDVSRRSHLEPVARKETPATQLVNGGKPLEGTH